ncbi:hypothetical protein NKR23_g9002 [Pleurostoma richardsiae]|uniref:MADS-box domain-containing protein n=1 Tax=Pleurostoma richardsiae TaxID=41990 RepID=A0AA38VKB8_9PEZI|nr:hypothetical protein NKR23_g9002 [Pleurostoma richardsiae]
MRREKPVQEMARKRRKTMHRKTKEFYVKTGGLKIVLYTEDDISGKFMRSIYPEGWDPPFEKMNQNLIELDARQRTKNRVMKARDRSKPSKPEGHRPRTRAQTRSANADKLELLASSTDDSSSPVLSDPFTSPALTRKSPHADSGAGLTDGQTSAEDRSTEWGQEAAVADHGQANSASDGTSPVPSNGARSKGNALWFLRKMFKSPLPQNRRRLQELLDNPPLVHQYSHP